MDIAVIGIGKLGLCSAACFAARGHRVIGVDARPEYVAALRNGECPIQEPGLPELLATCRSNLTFTTDTAQAIRDSVAALIIVPTPSESDGAFSNAAVEAVFRDMAPALAAKEDFYIVDVVSTVMPRTCETVFRPRLEALTGKRCGSDFGLVYNPEFIALGSVLHNFRNPDLVLIGSSDPRSGATIQELYASMVDNQPAYGLMSLTNAEITKLALNCYVTMKISFVNELTVLCENTPGADVDVVSSALGADSRIGSKYLRGGLGFGGPCFPRDNLAMQRYAAGCGCALRLSPAVTQVNASIVERLFQLVTTRVPAPGPVALLGLAYKPGTHIVEEAQGVQLAERLTKAGYAVRLQDPLATRWSRDLVAGLGQCVETVEQAVDQVRMVVLLTAWPEYEAVDWEGLEDTLGPEPWLLDSWRILAGRTFRRLSYLGLGLGGLSDN